MKPAFPIISFWFGCLMIVLVFSGAAAFAFTNFMDDRLFGQRRIVFVFILLAYGIYRSIRIYQSIKRKPDEM